MSNFNFQPLHEMQQSELEHENMNFPKSKILISNSIHTHRKNQN